MVAFFEHVETPPKTHRTACATLSPPPRSRKKENLQKHRLEGGFLSSCVLRGTSSSTSRYPGNQEYVTEHILDGLRWGSSEGFLLQTLTPHIHIEHAKIYIKL